MALVSGSPLVHEHSGVSNSHSHFDLNSVLGGTYRFGEISPHFVFRAVANDKRVRFMSATDTRSLNLKSPLMQDVKQLKDYFQVPMPAILPLNWDKLYVQPNIGDDVVAEDVGTTVEDFTGIVALLNASFCTAFENVVDSQSPSWSATNLRDLFLYLFWLSDIFSAGSLMSQFGNNLWPLFKVSNTNNEDYEFINFDAFYDSIISDICSALEASVDEIILGVPNSSGSSDRYKVLSTLDDSYVGNYHLYNGDYYPVINFRRFLELLKENPQSIIYLKASDYSDVTLSDNLLFDYTIQIVNNDGNNINSLPLNLDVFAAYQLACAEYFTNDKVDAVYSAELYRQVVRSALEVYNDSTSITGVTTYATFTYNGNSYLYDEFSSYLFREALDSISSELQADVFDSLPYFMDYWNLIFSVRNSLRYQDYFTGSKTRPLAPVDTDVQVNNGVVSMVDVAEKKGYLRLAFAVNRIGRKLSKYSQEIMGVAPPVDYHHPWYLAETVDYIGSTDTENTNVLPTDSTSQSTISNLRNVSNNYAFEVDVDIPSIIIGTISFDINRLYDRTYSRFNHHFDRYDMFNPLLQFTGDQAVYASEYDSASSSLNFGYQDKYMEYKMPINRAMGALVVRDALPGWCMVASDRFDGSGNIGLTSSFIRSYPHEFDRFYLSLLNYSPATYFHFIIKHNNSLSVDRPMVAKPKIM